jgi:hypothetical protein
MYRNFNGEELKEYVEHHIQEQVKAGVTSEGDCEHPKEEIWTDWDGDTYCTQCKTYPTIRG